MLKNRLAAAHQVSNRLFAAEQAIDAAIQATAELNAVIPVARTTAHLSAIVGHDAVEAAARSFAVLVQARREIVDAHDKLDAVKKQIGLREHSFGGGPQKVMGTHLSIVERDVA
jgi:hypothetical protein